MKKKVITICSSILLLFSAAVTTANQPVINQAEAKVKTVIKYNKKPLIKAKKIEKENKHTEKEIQNLDKKIKAIRLKLKKYSGTHAVESVSEKKLANLTYKGQDVITVNNNDPNFSKSDLNTNNGAWQHYGNLDNLNRVTAANALLNKSLMPNTEREPLHIDPTGWHNKRISSGWLYNRCHLIGYQLTGQNNNMKNLMTGTRQLNDPDMLRYEDQVTDYIKESGSNYVRYRVTPIFRGNELLARGVQMEAQSVNSNTIHFNVYIFNVQPGVKLNYSNGTSTVN